MALTYTWNAAFEASPADSDAVSAGAGKIRDRSSAVRERAEREHIWGVGETSSTHGWHRPGSSMCYVQATAPTLLPDETTALGNDALSKGRLWIDTDTGIISYWDGTAWTQLDTGTTIELIIEIGDWDMDASGSKSISHSLGASFKNVRQITGTIRNDGDTTYYAVPGSGNSTGLHDAMFYSIDSSVVTAVRRASGAFDSATFDSTSYNRGWVYLRYAGS